jgi:hypothetical protein
MRQLRENAVEGGTYLVAFRGDVGSSAFHFKGFRAEHQHFYTQLANRFMGDARVRDLDYITYVNLAHPSFDQSLTQTKPFQAQWSQGSLAGNLHHLSWGPAQLTEMPALISKVEFRSASDAAQALVEWEQNGDLWFAEPNGYSELFQINAQVAEEYKTATAASTALGWMKTIKLPEALKVLSQAKSQSVYETVVAVLDSGLDYEHPLLKDRVWVNPQPGAAGCGYDLNGCDLTAKVNKGELGIGEPHPYLTTGPGQACPTSEDKNSKEGETCGHGTHVAGIIAARLTPAQSVGGVCPVCKVMPLKIIAKNPTSGKGTADDAAILKALKYLVRFGTDRKLVRIANSSFGKYTRSRSVGLLITVLKNPPFETLVVGAAGNDDSMGRSYPAAFPEAVAVASIAAEGADNNIPLGKNSYSNFGPWVDVSAPGGTSSDIISTLPGGTQQAKQGTSMAAPVVAGVAGLVASLFNTISFNELRDRIVGYADPRIYSPNVASGINFSCYNPKFGGEESRNKLLGTGVVDAERAVSKGEGGILDTGYGNRVDGCGVVGTSRDHRFGPWTLLFLPGFLLLKRKIHRKGVRL